MGAGATKARGNFNISGVSSPSGTAQPSFKKVSSDAFSNAATTKTTESIPRSILGFSSNLKLDEEDEVTSPIPLGTQSNSLNYKALACATMDDIFGLDGSTARYIKKQAIGSGAFGEAFIVQRNPLYAPEAHPGIEIQLRNNTQAHPTKPRGLYVTKVMDLRSMTPQDRHYTQTEIMCLAHSHHFSIIKYYEHFFLDSDDETMVIVTEFADHGDLNRNLNRGRVFNGLVAAADRPSCLQLTEREVGTYFIQIILALHYIHSHRMIHRDIKSANLFLTSRGCIKLGDFGFSQQYDSTVSSESVAGTFLGTPYYVAPEMWRGTRYGKKADVWAAGVVLYEMLMDGQRPFDAASLPQLREAIVSAPLVVPTRPPPADDGKMDARGNFSNEMQELVGYILQKDPHQRPSMEELLHTPIMYHYLFLFERHVHGLISSDEERLRLDPQCDTLTLNFPDLSDRALVLEGIDMAKSTVRKEIQREITESASPHYEGIIYKEARSGAWKKRYLSLADNVLTISLSSDKEAANGGERSKHVPLEMVKAVNPCDVRDGQKPIGSAAENNCFTPPYAFAVSMKSSNSIIFGVDTEGELDGWLNTFMRALNME